MRAHHTPFLVLSLLAGCGGMEVKDIRLWPFGERAPAERSRAPANATEYRCDGGRGFWVRQLEGGDAWLIAPDREIRLPKLGGAGARYGIAKVLLEIDGTNAALTDPPAVFTNCKRPDKPA